MDLYDSHLSQLADSHAVGDDAPVAGSLVVWEDPPALTANQRAQAVADELRAKPGVWAIVSTHPSMTTAQSTASNIRSGRRAIYRPRFSFDATPRHVDGENRVYARYVGVRATEGTS